MDKIWIELNDVEQRLAKFLAKERYGSNRTHNVANGKVGPQSDDDTDLWGVGGELAFAKIFNLYPDLSIGPRRGGADCSMGPFDIDVKTTPWLDGRLLAVAGKSLLDADVYALVIAEFPRFGFCGFARASDLLHPSRQTDLGHGPVQAITQSELHAHIPVKK